MPPTTTSWAASPSTAAALSASGPADQPPAADPLANPLAAYFESHREGRGIWKWRHYFDLYHRHFSRFIGREVHVLEIGVYSGGSLEMWRHYFGPRCRIYGVDIQPACKTYEDDHARIFIGDQADRTFWHSFREQAPLIDILIDDGGHEPHQQIITIEEMLPHLRPGGVYLCEDIHGLGNAFAARAHALADQLNAFQRIGTNQVREEVARVSRPCTDSHRPEARAAAKLDQCHRVPEPDESRRLLAATNDPQRLIHSVHFYPFVCVIEKHATPVAQLEAPKHGTQWQPFL